MLFNSLEFIFIFLPLTLIVYFLLNKRKLLMSAKVWLVFMSLAFYSYWNIKYLPLILSSITFNYFIGRILGEIKIFNYKLSDKKIILIFGIVCNILLLAYYKYTNFFINNINAISGTQIHFLNLVLPLGISFFTFTQITYLVDAYKGEIQKMDYLNYALFVTFFPHLIAGPILHHSEMMPQFDHKRKKFFSYKNLVLGIVLFSIGLCKKVIIADSLAPYVQLGYSTPATLNFIEAWILSFAYTFQLYFDFSGYTDMALGASKMFNINLPINFNSPYKAQNIQEFWRRWHITLGRLLKNYIYIPMGGNKKGELNTYKNLILTFLIGGFWHGAGWTFVIWGLLHGIALVINRLWKKLNIKMHSLIALFITFNFVNITWIFFRANNLSDALVVLRKMFSLNVVNYNNLYHYSNIPTAILTLKECSFDKITILILFLALILLVWKKNSVEVYKDFKPSLRGAVVITIILFWGIVNLNKISEFLYFQF